jgi:hypothetical protein
MQRRKSQHNRIRKFFANVIIFKRKLDKHFKNLMRYTTRAITVFNREGNEAYAEAEHRHDLFFLKSPLGTTLPLQILSRNVERILAA